MFSHAHALAREIFEYSRTRTHAHAKIKRAHVRARVRIRKKAFFLQNLEFFSFFENFFKYLIKEKSFFGGFEELLICFYRNKVYIEYYLRENLLNQPEFRVKRLKNIPCKIRTRARTHAHARIFCKAHAHARTREFREKFARARTRTRVSRVFSNYGFELRRAR